MVTCKFFLEGTCKFGTSCRNEHPGKSDRGSNGTFSNSFSSLSAPIVSSSKNEDKDGLSTIVKEDLIMVSPLWPFSSYGLPGTIEPIHCGPDISLEEVMIPFTEKKRLGQQADMTNQLKSNAQKFMEERKLAYDKYMYKTQLSHSFSQPLSTSNVSNMSNPFGMSASSSMSTLNPPNPFGTNMSNIANPFSAIAPASTISNATPPANSFSSPGTISNPFALPVPSSNPFAVVNPSQSMNHSFQFSSSAPALAHSSFSNPMPAHTSSNSFLGTFSTSSSSSSSSNSQSFSTFAHVANQTTSSDNAFGTGVTAGSTMHPQPVYPISGQLPVSSFDYASAAAFTLGKVPETPPPQHALY